MKRTVITVDGNGMLSIPSNLQDLWMSEGELVDMLHVTAIKGLPTCHFPAYRQSFFIRNIQRIRLILAEASDIRLS